MDNYISKVTDDQIRSYSVIPIVSPEYDIMNIDIITPEDLKIFKSELIAELKEVLQPQQPFVKTWLKSAEVRKILSISPGTLQNLRINGTLHFKKIGGTMYYKSEDINRMLGDSPEEDGAV